MAGLTKNNSMTPDSKSLGFKLLASCLELPLTCVLHLTQGALEQALTCIFENVSGGRRRSRWWRVCVHVHHSWYKVGCYGGWLRLIRSGLWKQRLGAVCESSHQNWWRSAQWSRRSAGVRSWGCCSHPRRRAKGSPRWSSDYRWRSGTGDWAVWWNLGSNFRSRTVRKCVRRIPTALGSFAQGLHCAQIKQFRCDFVGTRRKAPLKPTYLQISMNRNLPISLL